MWPAVLGLAGVVIGALLGGLAQARANRQTIEATHRQWLREQRVEVYQAVLEQADGTILALWQSHAEQYPTSSPLDYDFVGGLEQPMTALELFGAASVAKAGEKVALTFNDMTDQMPADVDMVPIQQSRDAYLAAVRADLGVDGPANTSGEQFGLVRRLSRGRVRVSFASRATGRL